jgi:hypothetical protein
VPPARSGEGGSGEDPSLLGGLGFKCSFPWGLVDSPGPESRGLEIKPQIQEVTARDTCSWSCIERIES